MPSEVVNAGDGRHAHPTQALLDAYTFKTTLAEELGPPADPGSPFAGRRPVFIGDDVTDEYGFAVVNELGGMSIRVGSADGSAAEWQLKNVAELRGWLESAADAAEDA